MSIRSTRNHLGLNLLTYACDSVSDIFPIKMLHFRVGHVPKPEWLQVSATFIKDSFDEHAKSISNQDSRFGPQKSTKDPTSSLDLGDVWWLYNYTICIYIYMCVINYIIFKYIYIYSWILGSTTCENTQFVDTSPLELEDFVPQLWHPSLLPSSIRAALRYAEWHEFPQDTQLQPFQACIVAVAVPGEVGRFDDVERLDKVWPFGIFIIFRFTIGLLNNTSHTSLDLDRANIVISGWTMNISP